jgi:putative transposase
MGNNSNERACACQQWLDAGIAVDALQHLLAYARQGRALGDERFQRMMETTFGRPAACGRVSGHREQASRNALDQPRPF